VVYPLRRVKIETRGHSTQPKLLHRSLLFFFWETSFALFLWACFVALFHLAPLPTGKAFLAWLAALTATPLICWKILGRPLGFHLAKLPRGLSLGLTGALLWVAALSTHFYIFQHPALLPVEEIRWDPLIPDQSSGAKEQWLTLPAYFTLGAWPRMFQGQPVLFSLPYEKGPPLRFLGHLVARWKMPDATMTWEGPKSPENRESRVEWRSCFTGSRLHCGWMKQAFLERHLKDMKWKPGQLTKIFWFEVQDPAGKAIEQAPAGLWIEMHSSDATRSRAVLITEGGSQQVAELKDRGERTGEEARQLFQQMIRTLRLSDELKSGRALSSLRVSEVSLKSVATLSRSKDWVSSLSAIQATLMSRLTVEPKDLEAYYHLAGSGLVFLRKISETRKALLAQGASEDAMGLLLAEWAAAVRPTIQAAARYAEDVAPGSPRAKAVNDLWLEAQKFQ
jgi:hypothetical protein